MMKNQKGVTLIALVITIIVLIILAGVTVSRVVNKDGVVNKANLSARQTAIAKAKEEIETAINEVQVDIMSEDIRSEEMAEIIHRKFRELALNGSRIKDITYEYTGLDDLGGRVRERKAAKKADDIPKILDAAAAAEIAEPAEPAEFLEPAADRINTFTVRYKGERVLEATLNMRTAEVDFHKVNELDDIATYEPATEEVSKDEEIIEVMK